MAIKTDYTGGPGGYTSIANKEAAYALTSVAVGTVYKTEDTGQVLEKTGHVPAIQQSFKISDRGNPYNDRENPASNPNYSFTGDSDLWVWNATNSRFEFLDLAEFTNHITHNGTKWILQHHSDDLFGSPVCDASVHPADVVGDWTDVSVGMTRGEITTGDLTVYEPRNWKHDGTILVNDNDEKQLLTNLPDDQQVKIVGEGGRIEQLPPSPLPDIKRGFIISSDGNPRSSVSDGNNSVSGAFFWHETDGQFVRDDDGGYYSAYVVHDGSRWQIGYQMGYFFQSDLCASTVHPADATGWTAYDALAGIGQGTIADDGLVKTRACEVYNSPQYNTSGSTLWVTIKNMVYLTVYDGAFDGPFEVNGVTVEEFGTVGVGWVPVNALIPTTQHPSFMINFYTIEVNGENSLNFQLTPSTNLMVLGNDLVLPDIFPSGASVMITTAG